MVMVSPQRKNSVRVSAGNRYGSRADKPHRFSLPPSPGTPAEGPGEGSSANGKLLTFVAEPSPCPLPEYRERENAHASFAIPGGDPGAACFLKQVRSLCPSPSANSSFSECSIGAS